MPWIIENGSLGLGQRMVRISAADIQTRLQEGTARPIFANWFRAVPAPPPPPVPVNTTLPAVTGTAQVGQVLTTTNGSWSNSPTSYTRQWKADGANIAGATGLTYTPVVGDVGKVISCTVVAVNEGGNSAPANSNNTAAVIAAA